MTWILDEISVTVEEMDSDYLPSSEDIVLSDSRHSLKQTLYTCLRITVVAPCDRRRYILYGDYVGSWKDNIVFRDYELIVVKFTTLYRLNIVTGAFTYKPFPHMGGAFRTYCIEDGYVIHGECELIRLDWALNTRWSFSAADIHARLDGQESLRLYPDRWELDDFSGGRYVLNPQTGKEL